MAYFGDDATNLERSSSKLLEEIAAEIKACTRCDRLRVHCRKIAQVKRRAYIDEEYWGLPVPGFGDPKARLLVIGLAPAAHGANRTGRMFTGDSSGDWLYRALHKIDLASQPESVSIDDGLTLKDVYISAVGRCAPPENRLKAEEIRACRPFLERELDALLPTLHAVVCLGKVAFDTYVRILVERGVSFDGGRPKFGHGVHYEISGWPPLIGSYHPSRQNTQTGRLTQDMFDSVFALAKSIIH